MVIATDKDHGLTWEYLNDILDISPETGEMRWRKWRGGTACAGALAGSRNSTGYVSIKLLGRQFLAHRLMWFFVHREWPSCDLDHRDLNKSNNCLSNLREATRSQNIANCGIRADNRVRRRGVKKIGNRYAAFVTKDGVRHYFGCHATADEAYGVYIAAHWKLHGEFLRIS